MDLGTGSTLGLDFSKVLQFVDAIYKASGLTVHPLEDGGRFTMIVSFSRHDFCLDEDSVVVALEAAIGGSAIDFMVSLV